MKSLEVEQLIAQDIFEETNKAYRANIWDAEEAVIYRLKNIKRDCENLIARIDERLNQKT